MKGNIIGFDPDTNTGAISGHDGKRYDFVTADWHGQARPRQGDVVDFQPSGDRATQLYLVDAEYVQPSFGQFYFSPHGRISRSQYWLRFVLPYLIVTLVLFAIIGALAAAGNTSGAGAIYVVWALFALIAFWPSLAIYIKRVHDRDWPWPFILLLFVPVVQFWPMIEIMFLRGTTGSNRFGADPVPRQ
jgi:uncharacterized membrane protein YhaH (DUF805 family)